MPRDFSMTNHRLSQCRAVGTGHSVCTKQCLGGMRGLVGEGGGWSMITPTPFRFMVKTEGLLWMHVRGLVQHRPSTPSLPKQMFSRTNPSLFFTSFSVFLCWVSLYVPSYGKVSLLWSFYTAHLSSHFNLHLIYAVYGLHFEETLAILSSTWFWVLNMIINQTWWLIFETVESVRLAVWEGSCLKSLAV